jgi:lysophospholipid acyltransferase (LPLAT)-like uncharacterized protein
LVIISQVKNTIYKNDTILKNVIILSWIKVSDFIRYTSRNKCINVRRNTTVFSNCWRNQLHVSAFFWVSQHQVETQPDDGPPRKGTKYVVYFFNNF